MYYIWPICLYDYPPLEWWVIFLNGLVVEYTINDVKKDCDKQFILFFLLSKLGDLTAAFKLRRIQSDLCMLHHLLQVKCNNSRY